MNSFRLSIHGAMLADHGRNSALQGAIGAVVRPGDVVIDVGAGTGLLSLIAARAGASRVYALESTELARVAQRISEMNGYRDTIQVIQQDSRDWAPPELGNVVLSETLGFAALEEGFRATAADAYRRFLAPGGAFIPESVRIFAAPVQQPDDAADFHLLHDLCGFDFTPFQRLVKQAYQRAYIPASAQLAPPELLWELHSDALTDAPLRKETEFAILHDGELSGIALWFEAVLTRGILLGSRSSHRQNHWGQAYLAATEPARVRGGDTVSAELMMDDGGGNLDIHWRTALRRQSLALSQEAQ